MCTVLSITPSIDAVYIEDAGGNANKHVHRLILGTLIHANRCVCMLSTLRHKCR